jgi:DNA modification methylase
VSVRILLGDCREKLRELPDASVNCCVTSPPYFGLRDYGCEGQMGLEPTPDEFAAGMAEVFREVRRVLRDDGTLWLNIGDSYANDGKWGGHTGGKHAKALHCSPIGRQKKYTGLKPKDLIGIPWRLAFALQVDGWYLRRDIIWHKLNPMPESVRDRPTTAHEYIFLLSKSASYFYDADAIVEPVSPNTHARLSQNVAAQVGSARANGGNKTNGTMKAVGRGPKTQAAGSGIKNNDSFAAACSLPVTHRNKRSVWSVGTEAFSEAHFATYPPALIEPCILAGCPVGGTVLDPFGGAGTTGLVADRLGRDAILIELNPEYAEIAERRLNADAPLFAEVKAA